jgi:clorobiocin biosynthesis protein Clo-hal
MQSENVDVVVIGGGPAGCTAATLIKKARPSDRVLLCERVPFPRHHVGESLLPDSNPVLSKMGALQKVDAAGFQRKGGISFKWRTDKPIFSEWFLTGVNDLLRVDPGGARIIDHTWQVDRSRYDALLLAHAAERGVEVLQPASVIEVRRDGDRVTGVVIEHEGARRAVASKFVIDCSGQSRLLGRSFGLRIIEHDLGDLAIHRYYDGTGWSPEILGDKALSKIFFAASPAGWVWYIPLSTRLVSIGVVTRKELLAGRDVDEVFEEQLATVPEMTAMLGAATWVAPPCEPGTPPRTFVVSNWSYAHERSAGPGWYLAGDAAAFVDPVLSSGVTLAHHAGMWAANAVNTECSHPDVDPAALRAAYSRIYEDARAGFGVMAKWWYDHRQTATDDWWKQAANLMKDRGARGAEGMDDVTAFMHLVAGYLTDFRFTHIGVGFGTAGMSVVVGGMSGSEVRRAAWGEVDPSRRMKRAWDRLECDWYLGTLVESDRWWKLPMLRFHQGDTAQVYRPRVHCKPTGEPDLEAGLRALEEIFAACETGCAFGDLEGELRRLYPGSPVDVLLCEKLQDLVRMRLLEPIDAPPSPARATAASIADRSRVIRRAYARAELGRRETPSFDRAPMQFPVLTFTIGGEQLTYRPLPAQLRVLKALLESCDGKRSVEEVVRETRRRLGASADRASHDAANSLLATLVQLGALTVG